MRRLIFPILLGLIGCTILLGLGVWQVQRLQWKTAVLDEITSRIHADPVPLAEVPATADPDTFRYLPVAAQGVAGPEEIHVLTSAPNRGPGYRVIVPFTTQNRRVLLDLGFVPTEEKSTPRSYGPLRVEGNLQWPRDRTRWTPEPGDGIWYSREVADLARALKTEPLMIVARSFSGPTGTQPLPVTTTGIPNDHLGYAITWFGLALVWAVMSLLFMRRIQRSA